MLKVFEIEVFSSPISACGVKGFLKRDDIYKAAEYDEGLVRPAILLADKVRLVSQRIDKVHALNAGMYACANLSVPRTVQAAGVSQRRNPEEFEAFGLSLDDLVPHDEISDDLRECVSAEFQERFSTQIDMINRAIWDSYKSQVLDLGTRGLGILEESGILTVDRWSAADILTPIAVRHAESSEYLADSVQAVADRIANARSGLMLDSEMRELVRREQKSGEFRTEHELHGAADLMRMVSGFDAIPTGELLDVRVELADYLTPFRAFLLEVSRGIDEQADENSNGRQRDLELAWVREVEPAISEMRAMVSSRPFTRNLLTIDFDSLKGLVMGIALTGSAFYFGAAGAAPLTLAAPSIVESIQKTLRARGESKRNAVYFLYAMERLRRPRRRAKRSPQADS